MPVSLIIPTRNRPALLAHALDAVRAQTIADIELIVIDDSSEPDEAARNEVLVRAAGQQLAACHYQHLAQLSPRAHVGGSAQDGHGPSAVRNAGLALATGDLVAFCDDDDYWCDPAHLASAQSAFSGNPALDLVFANQSAVTAGAHTRAVWLPELEAVLMQMPAYRSLPAGDLIAVTKAQCLIEHFPHLNTCVFRRHLAMKIGGFWPEVRYHEDMHFFVRYLDVATQAAYRKATVAVHNVPDRTRAENMSTRLTPKEKLLANARVAADLLARCHDPAARRYAKTLARHAYGGLARHAHEERAFAEAADFARKGYRIAPSLKGALLAAGRSVAAKLR